jgi:nanoRNase/pAp phosphatase (c-di-AMP/oligoRNAs hydrolase)
MDTAVKEHRLAATALMHGLLTDTENFRRASDEDFIAAAYLSRFRDTDKLVQILREARSKHAMDIIQRALANRTNVENFSLAGIGYLRSEDRDTIPQAADFLLTEENVHTAIVFGIMSDAERGESLIGSLRTSKFNLDPDEFLKNVFGQDSGGRYYGGGRPLAGGFAIPLGFFSGGPNEEYRQIKWEVCDAQVRHRLFEKIGVGEF